MFVPIDLCLPPYPFPCHENADCVSSNTTFTCRCRPGFTGDGKNCSDINECQSLTACPSAKYECINSLGSFKCSCRYKSVDDSECGDSTNPPGWNIFNCTLTWLTWNFTGNISKLNNATFQKYARQYEKTLENLLSLGFQNKFHSLHFKEAQNGKSFEYRINVSSDTPHWFVKDYLARVQSYYEIDTSSVEDVDECVTMENNCSNTSLCDNTYGGYRCVCNASMKLEGDNCVSAYKSDGELWTSTSSTANYDNLLIALILGFGIPLVLLSILLIYCVWFKKKSGEAIIASAPPENLIESSNVYDTNIYNSEPTPFYKVHFTQPME
ncbi:uncharacterized protein [Pyxicephalus adspersus]|uniref:uncharacterized protein n=1 Tax=Pyxicephalus adspersus TaxID=30357 RepID=UPI003B58E9E4